MLELDITDFVAHEDPRRYSASQAELGPDAGAITWANAVEAAQRYPYITADGPAHDAFQAYLAGTGAWTRSELLLMTHAQATARLIQCIAHALRDEYEFAERITTTDDNRVYYLIGD
jgi:hypothetical protein